MKGYVFILAQAGEGTPTDVWEPAITFLEVLVGGASTLGIIVGALMILMNPVDDEKRVTGWQTICGSVMGLAIALLAVPLFNAFDGWMFGG